MNFDILFIDFQIIVFIGNEFILIFQIHLLFCLNYFRVFVFYLNLSGLTFFSLDFTR